MSTPERVPATVVPGHDVLSLVAARGGHCTAAELKGDVERTFGPEAVFGNCHGDRFDLDTLLAFLERKGKIARVGDDVTMGHVPACGGH